MRQAISIFGVFLLATLTISIEAQADSIGVYANEEATSCEIDMSELYTSVNIHFAASLSSIPSLTAVEFGTTGLDLLDAVAGWTSVWASPLVIGDPSSPQGGQIAFSEAQTGPVIYLGYITTFLVTPQPEVNLCIGPAESGNLLVVGADFIERDAQGWCAGVNCSAPSCDCFPNNGPDSFVEVAITSPMESDFIEGFYSTEFNIQSFFAGEGSVFSGSVVKDGATQDTFSGDGIESYSF